MERTHGERLAEAQIDEFPNSRLVSHIIDLVGNEHDGSARFEGPASCGHIFIGRSRGGIDDQQDQRGFRQGGVGLLGHLVFEFGASLQPSTGVDDVKTATAPFNFNTFPVASNTSQYLNDGNSSTGQPIDE